MLGCPVTGPDGSSVLRSSSTPLGSGVEGRRPPYHRYGSIPSVGYGCRTSDKNVKDKLYVEFIKCSRQVQCLLAEQAAGSDLLPQVSAGGAGATTPSRSRDKHAAYQVHTVGSVEQKSLVRARIQDAAGPTRNAKLTPPACVGVFSLQLARSEIEPVARTSLC